MRCINVHFNCSYIDTVAIAWLPEYQCDNPDGYGQNRLVLNHNRTRKHEPFAQSLGYTVYMRYMRDHAP